MSAFISDFLQSFFILFAIVDPFASLPLVITFGSKLSRRQQKGMVNTAVTVAGLTLLTFAVIGRYVLDFLGITIGALMIAGGILILLVGIEMVREGDKPRSATYKDIEEGELKEIAEDAGIVPIGIPMLAGPGSISLVIMLFSKYDAYSVLLSIVAVMLVSYIFFLFAPYISRAMGEKGSKVMTRIMGLLVAGFAVQFMLDGILMWYHDNF